jgi:serine/threonine protein kinase
MQPEPEPEVAPEAVAVQLPTKLEPGLPAEYEQLGKLGEGAFGTVFRARNNHTGQLVAIKRIRLKQDDAVRSRPGSRLAHAVCHGTSRSAAVAPPQGKVVREMMALQQLSHPNVRRPPPPGPDVIKISGLNPIFTMWSK